MIILAGVTLLLSSILYVGYERSALQTIKKTNAKLLSQVSYSFDYMNLTAQQFTWWLYENFDTVSLMYQDSNDYLQLIGAWDRIHRAVQINSFVHSVYIYNSKLDRYLASGKQVVNDARNFHDQELVKLLRASSQERPPRLLPIPRLIEDESTHVFTYLLYDVLTSEDESGGAVVVNIHGEYLQTLMQGMKEKDGFLEGDIFVSDDDGQLISAAQDTQYDDETMQDIANRVAEQLNADSGYFTARINGQKVMISYLSAGSIGWKFIHSMPYHTAIADIQKFRNLTIMAVIGLLLMGTLTSLFVALRLYSPIRNLVGKMTTMLGPLPDKTEVNEIAFFDSAFSKAYSAMRDELYTRKEETFRSLLLHPDIDSQRIPTFFSMYKIKINPNGRFLMIALHIDSYRGFTERFNQKDQTLFRYSLVNIATEIFGEKHAVESVDMGNDHIIVLVESGDEPLGELLSAIEDECSQIQKWSSQHLKLSLSISIGSSLYRCTELAEGYQEVSALSRYRIVAGHQALLTAEWLRDASNEEYRLSQQEESLLYEAIVNGKLEDTRAAFDQIMEQLKSQSYDTILTTIHYLAFSVYDTMTVMEKNGLRGFEIDFNSWLRTLLEAETLGEISQSFYALFAHMADIVNSKKENRSSVLVETMCKMIMQNYADQNLSLSSIADALNMSKVHVGKVFRDMRGQSVAEYILDIRMDRVMEMLHESNKPLEVILNQCGIVNKKYFYTLFKKKTGVTFSEYKLKKGSSIE